MGLLEGQATRSPMVVRSDGLSVLIEFMTIGGLSDTPQAVFHADSNAFSAGRPVYCPWGIRRRRMN